MSNMFSVLTKYRGLLIHECTVCLQGQKVEPWPNKAAPYYEFHCGKPERGVPQDVYMYVGRFVLYIIP